MSTKQSNCNPPVVEHNLFLGERDVVVTYGIPPTLLADARRVGDGPPFRIVDGHVEYNRIALENWLRAHPKFAGTLEFI